MPINTFIESFHHNNWTCNKLIYSATPLTDSQLNHPFQIHPGLNLSFRLGESRLQLTTHSTLHRPQILNLLRHPNIDAHNLDMYIWSPITRETTVPN